MTDSVWWLRVGLVLATLLVLVKPLGIYMARVYGGERTVLDPLLRPLERGLYRIAGVRPDEEIGSGMYGMLAFVIVATFTAGLMIGRTPEYLGKKIEAFEMKMATLIVLVVPAAALVAVAVAVATAAGRAGVSNPGPHGLSQVAVRVHVDGEQQRQRLRRPQRQHAVL